MTVVRDVPDSLATTADATLYRPVSKGSRVRAGQKDGVPTLTLKDGAGEKERQCQQHNMRVRPRLLLEPGVAVWVACEPQMQQRHEQLRPQSQTDRPLIISCLFSFDDPELMLCIGVVLCTLDRHSCPQLQPRSCTHYTESMVACGKKRPQNGKKAKAARNDATCAGLSQSAAGPSPCCGSPVPPLARDSACASAGTVVQLE